MSLFEPVSDFRQTTRAGHRLTADNPDIFIAALQQNHGGGVGLWGHFDAGGIVCLDIIALRQSLLPSRQ
jgi:hypothetical protein